MIWLYTSLDSEPTTVSRDFAVRLVMEHLELDRRPATAEVELIIRGGRELSLSDRDGETYPFLSVHE